MTETENKGRAEADSVGSPLRPATAMIKIIVTIAHSVSQPGDH